MEVNITEFPETEDAARGFDINWRVGGGWCKVVGGSCIEYAELVGKIESGSKEHPAMSEVRKGYRDLGSRLPR